MTDLIDYAVEVEVFEESDFLQEMMSPTFIILASCIAVATLVVVLLLALICNKICQAKTTGYTVPEAQVQK